MKPSTLFPPQARHIHRTLPRHPNPHLPSNPPRIPPILSQSRALTTSTTQAPPPTTSPSQDPLPTPAPAQKPAASAAHKLSYDLVDNFVQDRESRVFSQLANNPRTSNVLNDVASHLSAQRADIERQAPRRWDPGDVYKPADLGPMEMQKWKYRKPPSRDVFDLLGIDPEGEWKNPVMMAEFMTRMGRIRHSKETGLRPVNQRKIARAIRRAVGMGFLPSVHVHPEMLRRDGPWQYK